MYNLRHGTCNYSVSFHNPQIPKILILPFHVPTYLILLIFFRLFGWGEEYVCKLPQMLTLKLTDGNITR